MAEFGSFLCYNPETGFVTRTANRGRWKVGSQLGWLRKDGYIGCQLGGKEILVHRLGWFLYHGVWPVDEIDHINGIKYDNRLINLRQATRKENNQNILRAKSQNKLGVLGVHKNGYKYIASIRADHVKHYLGTFDTIEDASAAYVAAKEHYHKTTKRKK